MAALPARSEQITEHFTYGEVYCKCGCEMPGALIGPAFKTAKMAEKVRELLGGHPLKVHSWYRCSAYNAKIGGKPKSMHLKASAVDFNVRHLTPHAVQAKCQEVQGITVGGLGKYPGFTHIDIGPVRTWEG